MNWSAAWPTPENETLEQQLEKLSRDEVLMKWEDAKSTLAKAKEDEMIMRKFVVKKAFPTPNEGTNTLELGANYELKAVIKYNYNLKDNKTVEETLDKIASVGNQGAYIAPELVGWTPNFHLTPFRKLEEEANEGNQTSATILKLCHEMLIITPAAPTVTIKENKKK